MRRQDVVIVNRLGLHARAAARFVQAASQFKAAVRISSGGTTTDGKSILGLLILAAAQGTVLSIETAGVDDEAALTALAALVARGFDET